MSGSGLSPLRCACSSPDSAVVRYDSVRRFIQKLGRTKNLPFRRMECGPGEEAQVDFGTGAPVIVPDHPSGGAPKRRKTNVVRIVLSHSRKAYSEATFTQTTEDFFRNEQISRLLTSLNWDRGAEARDRRSRRRAVQPGAASPSLPRR